MTENDISSKIPSYLTNDIIATHTKLRMIERFVFLKNNVIDVTNKNKNNVKFIPSREINNNRGSKMNNKHPNNAKFLFTNFLKR